MSSSHGRFGPVLAGFLVLVVLNANSVFAAPGHQPLAKQGRAVVRGGIRPCSGLPPPMVHGLPRYAAGTVFVLQGHVTWGKWRRGSRPAIFPSLVVAKETVRINTMYRFVLFPGHYVLTARLPHSNVRPFVQIIVKRGVALHADLPNMCM